VTEHPDVTPNNIKASKDFMRCVAIGIEGMYDDPDACLSSVVQTYKNFTAGWQWKGHEQINACGQNTFGVKLYPGFSELSFHVRRWCDQPVQYIRKYHVDIDLAERSDDSIFPEIPKAIGSLCKEFEVYACEVHGHEVHACEMIVSGLHRHRRYRRFSPTRV
jgi:hypothetical protein